MLILFVVVWQLVSTGLPGLRLLLPPPTAVAGAAWELAADGTLQAYTVDSLRRFISAIGLAILLGVPLGLALGGSYRFWWSVNPIIEFLRPIPPLAWIPLSILWFGISDTQNIFIIWLAAFYPLVLNTAAGVRSVDVQLIQAAQSLGARRLDIPLTVTLPAALPYIIVGLRVGMGIGWLALVAAELVGANSGLGYLISLGRNLFRSDYIVVGMVAIGLIGMIIDVLILMLQRWLLPWQKELR